MLAGLQRRGLDGAPLLARAGIDLAETDTRIPVERYALLYNLCVEALEDEAFGLLPEPMRPGSFEFLCRALLGAPTLGEALLRAIRFLRIVLPAFRIELRVDGARAELLLDDGGSLGPGPAYDPGKSQPGNAQPDWVVELTDPGPAGPVAGTDQGGTGIAGKYVQMTVTGVGQVRPRSAGQAACGSADDKAAAMSAGTKTTRAIARVPIL